MSRWGMSRTGVIAVLGWVVAAGLAGSIAWRAVAVIDTDTSASGVLSPAQVDAALAAMLTTATPRSPAPSATADPTPTSTPLVEVVRSWSLTGGTVAAACRDTVITLLYATPSDGWTVEVKGAGPDELVIELESDDAETTVQATCVAGTPEQRSVEHLADDSTGSSPGTSTVQPSLPEDSDQPEQPDQPDDSEEPEEPEQPSGAPEPSED